MHPRVFTCTRMRLRVSAWCRLFPARISCFQKKKVFFRVRRVHRVPCISRASCFNMHQNISACIYVHPRASTRISEGVVLEYSIKSKIALISVTICSFSIRDRHLLNVREKSFKVWYRGSEGIWGLRNSVNRALQSPPTLHIWIFMSSTLLARIVKNAPFMLIFFSNRSEFCGESDFQVGFVRENIDFIIFEEPGNHLDSRLEEMLLYLVMLATTSIQRRDMIHLPEAAVGDSRHDYRHEIRHEVGLGIYSRIYMRPTRISSSSHISTVRQWNPFLSRACRCVLHVTCILVHPHAPACIHVHSHASTCIRLMPTVSSPDFTFSEKKFSFACFACIACLFYHVPRALTSTKIYPRAFTCIHVHPHASAKELC